ncbi:hypothetical protein [Corynebacterium heidelbergense]|uniref:Uncharacterized protein n=1 Tax=Corynebacterium heidelbergense TaxID=2055947 RepID=A0A364VAE3_9CORY|nr:hypothetical protein [Corynebacterium heidelbergense]RAV33622.1 hypothetical protein CWC39_07560 [Corynebacterium heidelbergense]WCZ35770.1 hypothetical protein CHEID_00960 [Corynebacterium heidelbergense]
MSVTPQGDHTVRHIPPAALVEGLLEKAESARHMAGMIRQTLPQVAGSEPHEYALKLQLAALPGAVDAQEAVALVPWLWQKHRQDAATFPAEPTAVNSGRGDQPLLDAAGNPLPDLFAVAFTDFPAMYGHDHSIPMASLDALQECVEDMQRTHGVSEAQIAERALVYCQATGQLERGWKIGEAFPPPPFPEDGDADAIAKWYSGIDARAMNAWERHDFPLMAHLVSLLDGRPQIQTMPALMQAESLIPLLGHVDPEVTGRRVMEVAGVTLGAPEGVSSGLLLAEYLLRAGEPDAGLALLNGQLLICAASDVPPLGHDVGAAATELVKPLRAAVEQGFGDQPFLGLGISPLGPHWRPEDTTIAAAAETAERLALIRARQIDERNGYTVNQDHILKDRIPGGTSVHVEPVVKEATGLFVVPPLPRAADLPEGITPALFALPPTASKWMTNPPHMMAGYDWQDSLKQVTREELAAVALPLHGMLGTTTDNGAHFRRELTAYLSRELAPGGAFPGDRFLEHILALNSETAGSRADLDHPEVQALHWVRERVAEVNLEDPDPVVLDSLISDLLQRPAEDRRVAEVYVMVALAFSQKFVSAEHLVLALRGVRPLLTICPLVGFQQTSVMLPAVAEFLPSALPYMLNMVSGTYVAMPDELVGGEIALQTSMMSRPLHMYFNILALLHSLEQRSEDSEGPEGHGFRARVVTQRATDLDQLRNFHSADLLRLRALNLAEESEDEELRHHCAASYYHSCMEHGLVAAAVGLEERYPLECYAAFPKANVVARGGALLKSVYMTPEVFEPQHREAVAQLDQAASRAWEEQPSDEVVETLADAVTSTASKWSDLEIGHPVDLLAYFAGWANARIRPMLAELPAEQRGPLLSPYLRMLLMQAILMFGDRNPQARSHATMIVESALQQAVETSDPQLVNQVLSAIDLDHRMYGDVRTEQWQRILRECGINP